MKHFTQKIYHNLYFRIGLALAWLGLIYFLMLATLPDVGLPEPYSFIVDKIVHFILFGSLTILLWRALKTLLRSRWLRMFYAFALTFSYAYLMEYLQSFTATRTVSAWDLFWGAVGIVTAEIIIWYYRERKPSLLIHLCCGPCGSAILENLKKTYRVTLLFANSNIDTASEFHKRWRTAKKLANFHGLKLIKSRYTHEYWQKLIIGHEDAPEKGSRCQICYRSRMYEAGMMAKIFHFDYFTTTLTTSPHKDRVSVLNIGRDLEKMLEVKFLDVDFGEGSGYQDSISASKKLKLYRQNYCGCEYSKGHLKK